MTTCKNKISILFFTLVLLGLVSLSFAHNAWALTGINRTINFQGKLVTSSGLNVADGSYSVVFSFYGLSSGGTAQWTETQTVTTVDGIFRATLGSVTPIPANFNFNWDGIYLGMKVGADLEMTPRIRMAAVPYAFNAEKVAGLTVQDESGNASTSGTLKIPNNKIISFGGAFSTTAGNDLSFTTSANTTISFGGSGALTALDTTSTQTMTNKTIGSTGLVFAGATTDITTGTNENFSLIPNGNGLIGFGITAPSGFFHVSGGNQGGNALAIFDQIGAVTNDIFTASASGVSKFSITNSGGIKLGNSVGTAAQCLLSGGVGAAASWGACGSGTSQWTTSGTSIYYNTGNVGIGTSTPTHAILELAAATAPAGGISFGGDVNLYRSINGTTNLATDNVFELRATDTPFFASNLGNANNVFFKAKAASEAEARVLVRGTGEFTYGSGATAGVFDMRLTRSGVSEMTLDNNSGGAANLKLTGSAYLAYVSGNVGIGTTNPGSKLDVETASTPTTDMANINNAAFGATATGVDGLQIDYATAGTTASVDNAGIRVNVTSGNSGATTTLKGIDVANLTTPKATATETGLRIGTGWDVGVSIESGGLVISGGSFSYSGTSRPTRAINLSPEYAGAVLTAYYGAGTDTNITGNMTSDTDTTQGTSIRNYYQWQRTTDATQHFYTVAVRVTLPKDFSAWTTTNAITIAYKTDSATTTLSSLDARIYNENSATIVASSTGNASTSWTTVSFAAASLTGWATADQTAVIYLRMGSASSNAVKIGDIKLSYLTAF